MANKLIERKLLLLRHHNKGERRERERGREGGREREREGETEECDRMKTVKERE